MNRAARVLAESLDRYGERLERALHRARSRPGEKEVHRLRVATRRVRAALRLAIEVPGAATARRARKRLRRLGQVLGEQRMWDVAIAGIAGHYSNAARFEAKRRAATRAVAGELRRIDPRALREDLAKLAKLLLRLPAGPYAARVRGLRSGLAAALARPSVRAESRHNVRICVKKARYLLEASGLRTTAARRLQGLLGHEHDLHLLQQIAGANARVRALEVGAREDVDRAWAPDLRATIAALDRLLLHLREEVGDRALVLGGVVGKRLKRG